MIVQVILNDPFLGKRIEEGNFTTVPLRDEFLENARLFIFETYCRIHQRIDMGYVPDTVPLVQDLFIDQFYFLCTVPFHPAPINIHYLISVFASCIHYASKLWT